MSSRTVSNNTVCFETRSSNVTFDQICHCPAQEPIKLLFQVFARYFTFSARYFTFSSRYFTFSARYFNKNSKTTNQSDLRNNAQHVIKVMSRSIFGPVLESIRYDVNSAWGNRTGPDRSGAELFTPYGIDICFGLAKANLPSSPRER